MTAGSLRAETTVTINPLGVTVTPTPMSITEGADFHLTLVLDTQPTSDVTITSIPVWEPAKEVSRTFTTENWNDSKTIRWSMQSDTNTVGAVSYIAFEVTGGDYDGIGVDRVKTFIYDADPQMKYTLAGVQPVEEGCGHGARHGRGGNERIWSA